MKRAKQTGTTKSLTDKQRNPQQDTNSVYRSAQFQEWAKDRNILSIALDVHMTTEGSYERSKEDQENDIAALKWVISYWKHSNKVFDALVLSIIGFVIREAGYDII